MSLRNELLQYYRWLRQHGLNDSHSGNASVRNGKKVWITPTGACADNLSRERLIPCRVNQPPNDGASLDAPLHLAVYRGNPAAHAVLHSHGPYTVALTMDGQDFIPPDFEGQYYFQQVRVLDIPYYNCIEDAVEPVAEVLAEAPIVVVRGHGMYAQGESLEQAYKWICSLELSAQTAFLSRQLR